MSPRFVPGQLVRVRDELLHSKVCLYDVPGVRSDARVLGMISCDAIAIVIAINATALEVYVYGSTGAGWAAQAFFIRVDSS